MFGVRGCRAAGEGLELEASWAVGLQAREGLELEASWALSLKGHCSRGVLDSD